MDKEKELNQIKERLLSSNLCPHLEESAKNLVFGEGSADAELVFIGEAPGEKEDLSGRPFVGRAGNFLSEMLDKIGLSRNDVYITNIVKYRPPENRDPSEDEKEAFYPYLIEQLEIIQPKILVTLGRHSMNLFLPEKKIGQIHGVLEQINLSDKLKKLYIMPFFHPAAALYNGSLRSLLIDDFQKLPDILNSKLIKNFR